MRLGWRPKKERKGSNTVSNAALLVTMASVFIGFCLFGGSFASFMYRKPKGQIWGLFALAVVFITIIPTTVAIFYATSN